MILRLDEGKFQKRCPHCDKFFVSDTEGQKKAWQDHVFLCFFTSKRFIRASRCIQASQSTVLPPYIIQNGFKKSNELNIRVKEMLSKYFICVIDDYASKEIAKDIRNEIRFLYTSPNKLFFKADKDNRNPVRSDLIYWMSGKESITPNVRILKRSLNYLINSLRLTDTSPVKNFTRFQISCLPKSSAGIAVHVDNPDDNGCLLSVVYYCNENYAPFIDGGEHRFFLYDKRSVVDIEPIFNRVVIYWSDCRVAHGVCSPRRDLFSLAAWYINKDKDFINSTEPKRTFDDQPAPSPGMPHRIKRFLCLP